LRHARAPCGDCHVRRYAPAPPLLPACAIGAWTSVTANPSTSADTPGRQPVMMRRLYDWMMRMAVHPNAPRALFGVAFVESSIFPIPPDIMLVPMILAERSKAWTYASICLIGSVLGGLLGYAIGYYLFASIGEPILDIYGLSEKYAQAKTLLADWGPWILIAKGFTPFPYKVL